MNEEQGVTCCLSLSTWLPNCSTAAQHSDVPAATKVMLMSASYASPAEYLPNSQVLHAIAPFRASVGIPFAQTVVDMLTQYFYILRLRLMTLCVHNVASFNLSVSTM